MVKKDDKIFELICIASLEHDPNEEVEVSMGFYSSQKIADREKRNCEEINENNIDLKYKVKEDRVTA